MVIRFSSLKPILDCLTGNKVLSPSEIGDILGKSKVIVHRYLKELISQWKVKKIWTGSHVKYTLLWNKAKENSWKQQKDIFIDLPYEQLEIIEQTFYKFTESSTLLMWVKWFIERCNARNMDIEEKAKQFVKIKLHIDKMKNKCGLLEATQAFKNNVSHLYLDHVYYADQYNWMEFGRGKLAELTFYAKQSQNKQLINQAIEMILLQIQCIIQHSGIDAIAIIPPSIPRIHQLLKILHNKLKGYHIPFIPLVKYSPSKIPVPQKSLKSREQRIRNAKETILVNEIRTMPYKKILLIDDFVWSGSTLNETAHKLKELWIKQVIWFSFVGNTNLSYDVINEI